MNSDIRTVENSITSLIPDTKIRKVCLSIFAESLKEANEYGANKWGVYYSQNEARLRLLVGNLIVLSLHKQDEGVWITLEQRLLEIPEKEDLLNRSPDWSWDTGTYANYKAVPSKNGYYVPSEDHLRIWPVIRQLHLAYIGKVAKKYSQLRENSQRNHMPQVLAYLRSELKQNVPEPIYTDSMGLVLSQSNAVREIEQYQTTYQDLPKTEREAVIQSRIGQGKFRAKLISYWHSCAVTGCQSIELLRASHIKPWRDANNDERLDLHNGLLLIPNLDAAFDTGLISFTDDGRIIISGLLSEEDRQKLNISTDMRITNISGRHCEYLEYHRNNILKKAR